MALSLKKFTPILLGVLLLNLLGFYGYFFVRLHDIHESSKAAIQRIPKSELTHFVFSAKEFNSLKIEEHEIQVQEKMYDIAFTEREGSRIHVYGLHDAAEDNLLAFIQSVVKQVDGDSHRPEQCFVNYLTLFFTAPEQIELPVNIMQLISFQSGYRFSKPENIQTGIFHPPAHQV
jgi:hypothetical protein